MPSIYRPRRPRASPLWHIVHHAWGEFESGYERFVRPEALDRRLEVPQVSSLRPSAWKTMPKPLRGIFRKRRKLLDHLFRVSLETLRDWMRARLMSGWRREAGGRRSKLMRDHTKLRAFQLADELAVRVYKHTAIFPKKEMPV